MQNRLFTYFSPNLLFSLFNSPCYRDVRGHVNDSLHFVHPLVCVCVCVPVLYCPCALALACWCDLLVLVAVRLQQSFIGDCYFRNLIR